MELGASRFKGHIFYLKEIDRMLFTMEDKAMVVVPHSSLRVEEGATFKLGTNEPKEILSRNEHIISQVACVPNVEAKD
jgi:hypothetical protein